MTEQEKIALIQEKKEQIKTLEKEIEDLSEIRNEDYSEIVNRMLL